MASQISPFLHPGSVSAADSLSIVHLRRDLQVPTILRARDEDGDGYSEGKVVNTRFGSFPHKTLIGLPWGSQVRASKVDTGSRGRRGKKQEKKRTREEQEDADGSNKRPKLVDEQGASEASTPAAAKEETDTVVASSGFIHLLPPTPENWTISLPHRTQVVYTPDYSYILHRLRARPGTHIIEAGAGSGSFTHASSRAVYSGYPEAGAANGSATKRRKLGKVWSFEFHEQRHEKLQEEIKEHGLDGLVQITHRDVCKDGFLVDGNSPQANAVFLDLPAPWLALPHLSRSKPALSQLPDDPAVEWASSSLSNEPFISPLSSTGPVHLCTFSPCIEQVQRTISAMRRLGWVDISMVEISQKRIDVMRQRVGIDNGAQRGVLAAPTSVDEALQRLLEVEGAFKRFHEVENGDDKTEEEKEREREAKLEKLKEEKEMKAEKNNPINREKIIESLVENKIYKEGRLVHRPEQEVKTHTSYLVFAILPQEWSEEDEKRVRAERPILIRKEDGKGDGNDQVLGVSKRQMKRAERLAKKVKEKEEREKEKTAVDVKTQGEQEDGENKMEVVEEQVVDTEDQKEM